ncbi:MAG: 50S ribosomal protein L18 [Candidatus Sungbacteria bacterium RIFCSPLOWO2_01_FULL_59_16]|uniref:Large ribosomal subunit protein uL18 n=1 Tax=Candidatus Sungbacteria bacterium RIFCSPLOWO2_01_FULL_59_16 TaxID=1802280 RepID=A0A1G2LDT3_9BACT|nr:MAG: 50S ribosomal protein L18 [Candidatus Sungbacteria bacterium RIFCSPLOWO2_01_FULL_59_16]
MKRVKEKRIKRHRRAERARAKPRGAADRSRLSVFHSNRYLWAQVIDDASGRTLASASDREVSHSGKRPKAKSLSRRERAGWVGERIAERAIAAGARAGSFDRGSRRYHGLVAALAEGARKGGLKF